MDWCRSDLLSSFKNCLLRPFVFKSAPKKFDAGVNPTGVIFLMPLGLSEYNYLLRGHRMQKSLFKLFEHKCVLEVCEHIHSIMIKITQCLFLIPILKSPFSNVTLEHKTRIKSLGYICSNSQKYMVRVKMIYLFYAKNH